MKRSLAVAILLAAACLGGRPAAAQSPPPEPAQVETAPPAKPAAKPPRGLALEVARVHFRGNRRVEDDAIKVLLRTQPGVTLTQEMLRDDVRVIWKMGYFEDVQVETSDTDEGVVVVFALKEKPSVRKIYVAGNDEIALSKINEVLDIKKEQILDVAKVKKNVEKIKDLYLEKGFYMAEVDYELRRDEPGEVDVWFRCRENAKVEVKRVNFVGNKAATDADLREVMMTREGSLLSVVTQAGTYREDMFERDMIMVQSWYFDRGYINVKVGNPRMELSPDKRSLTITITVEEGEPYVLGTIDIKGDLIEDRRWYLDRLSVRSGETFNRSRLGQDIQHLTDFYKDAGYAYVNASPITAIDEKTRRVDLTFDIQKGKPVSFERINVRGNSKTRDKVIRREMRISEGDLYSQSLLDRSKQRVNALGFFERVDMSTKRGSSDESMEVNMEVAERPTGTFQIGAGFSSVENFIAQAQISQNNLLGRGQLLTVQAQLSSLRQLVLLQFQEPYFLDTNWTFGFNLFNQERLFTSFSRKSTGGSLTWGYLVTDDVRVLLTYTLESIGVSTSRSSGLLSGGQRSPIPRGSIANLLRNGITSSARISLLHDTRDNRLFPRKGFFNSLSWEVADDPWTGSQNVFQRQEAVMRFFYPVLGPFVFRMKLEGGLIASRDPLGVPISERYFVGGIFDVRGFVPRSLGPQIRAPGDQSNEASLINFRIGGNLQVIGNAEVEFPIFDKVGIRGVVFTDVGNAFNLESQYCKLRPNLVDRAADPCLRPWDGFDTLRSSWGFGFRWFSPIGPLRFEWGIPFRTLPGEQSIVFEFTIGNFF